MARETHRICWKLKLDVLWCILLPSKDEDWAKDDKKLGMANISLKRPKREEVLESVKDFRLFSLSVKDDGPEEEEEDSFFLSSEKVIVSDDDEVEVFAVTLLLEAWCNDNNGCDDDFGPRESWVACFTGDVDDEEERDADDDNVDADDS